MYILNCGFAFCPILLSYKLHPDKTVNLLHSFKAATSSTLLTNNIGSNAKCREFWFHSHCPILLHFTRAVTSKYMLFLKKSKLFWAAKKIATLDYFHDPGWPANSGVQTVPNKHIKMVR